VVGKIPQSALYAPGMAILNWYPLPTITTFQAGQTYNFETTYPKTDLIGYQPVIRLDYQPFANLRGSFKFFEYQQPNDPSRAFCRAGTTRAKTTTASGCPAANVNWTINSTTFAEFSWGGNYHHQEGCSVTGAGPELLPQRTAGQCRLPNRNTGRLRRDPLHLSGRRRCSTRPTFAYEVIKRSGTTDLGRQRVQVAPTFTWAGRVAELAAEQHRSRSATSSWTRRPATSTPASRG
jgi:hypothetical protein